MPNNHETRTFPVSAKISYIIEEYLRTIDSPLEYAWWCGTREEAEAILIEQMRWYGHDRMYSMYIHIEG